MKKIICFLLCMTLVLSFSACVKIDEARGMSTDNSAVESEEKISDTASKGGYTIKIVAAHKTVDSYGNPIVALEFKYKNENSEPDAFPGGNSIVSVYQDGVECLNDSMVLERDFDWDTAYTAIKDGAEITVFSAWPLRNETSPLEVNVQIYDSNGGNPSNAKAILELVS